MKARKFHHFKPHLPLLKELERLNHILQRQMELFREQIDLTKQLIKQNNDPILSKQNRDPLLTVKESAAYLGCSISKIRRLYRQQKISPIKPNDPKSKRLQLKFRKSDLERFIEAHRK